MSDYFDHLFIMNIVQGTHTKHTDKNKIFFLNVKICDFEWFVFRLADGAIDLATMQAAGAATASKSHLYRPSVCRLSVCNARASYSGG